MDSIVPTRHWKHKKFPSMMEAWKPWFFSGKDSAAAVAGQINLVAEGKPRSTSEIALYLVCYL